MFVAATMLATTSACTSSRTADSDQGDGHTLIGISMPTRSLERWNKDGAHLQERLKKLGYETTLQYADSKVDQQITQIENMINQHAKVVVVAPHNDSSLGPVLDEAKAANVKVIAYDRLINKTPNVDYYATFDNYQVGRLQGQYIEEKLGLKSGKGPFNLEPFAGDPADNNARFFFTGAFDVLKPYLDSHQLTIPSGKKLPSADAWTSIAIAWDSQKAQAEMDNRLNSFYTNRKVDVVLSPNDSLALGIEQSLESHGYKPGGDWPLVTGQDADLANTKNILNGKQAMTVWKDTRQLGDRVATMVQSIVKGEQVEVNDTKTYDNGSKTVPAYLLPLVVVTKDNVQEKLVGSGAFTAEQLSR
jgi:putative multiple sugar transport system substrate-binding protein